MNPTTEINKKNKFTLWSFLYADLLRQEKLLKNKNKNKNKNDKFAIIKFFVRAFSPRFIPNFLCRLAHSMYLVRIYPLAKLFSTLNFLFFGIEISIRCPIGKGLYLPHTHGTVIGAWEIGENVTIFQGVTLGAKELDFSYRKSFRPIIQDGVVVGAGAKILGGVNIGERSIVGANAVVLIDVPSDCFALGIPARIKNKSMASNSI